MKTELVHTLTATFEGHAQKTEGGVEFWLARDLQHLLGYTNWENFLTVLDADKRARTGPRAELKQFEGFAGGGQRFQRWNSEWGILNSQFMEKETRWNSGTLWNGRLGLPWGS